MQFELLPPVPAVVLAHKLRQIPLFEFASVDELFRFSAFARQIRHLEGAIFQREGTPVEHIQILIEGKVIVTGQERDEAELSPPALLGFREVLEGTRLRETARAKEGSTCLALGAEDFRSLLSDNIELAEGLFRMLLSVPSAEGNPSLLKGVIDSDDVSVVARPGLKSIEKILFLQQLPIFSHATPDELMELTTIVHEVPLVAGKTAFDRGDPPAIWIIRSGKLSMEPPESGDLLEAGAGDVVGIEETLSGASTDWRALVEQDGLALKIERDNLFSLLADHVELLQGLFGAVFQSSAGGDKK